MHTHKAIRWFVIFMVLSSTILMGIGLKVGVIVIWLALFIEVVNTSVEAKNTQRGILHPYTVEITESHWDKRAGQNKALICLVVIRKKGKEVKASTVPKSVKKLAKKMARDAVKPVPYWYEKGEAALLPSTNNSEDKIRVWMYPLFRLSPGEPSGSGQIVTFPVTLYKKGEVIKLNNMTKKQKATLLEGVRWAANDMGYRVLMTEFITGSGSLDDEIKALVQREATWSGG